MIFVLIAVLFIDRTYEDLHNVKLVRVYDGDTIIVNIPHEPKLFGEQRGVRIRGIDTPEMHDPRPLVRAKAIHAKNVVEQKLKNAKRIDLTQTGREKYDRILARVVADGVDIGDLLLKRGLAKPYDGGHKDQNW